MDSPSRAFRYVSGIRVRTLWASTACEFDLVGDQIARKGSAQDLKEKTNPSRKAGRWRPRRGSEKETHR
jgi:hypothetical protein